MIGIVRHLKVIFKTNRKWMTAKQFNGWVEQYDQANLWMMFGRIAWFFSHKSQSESKSQTLQRAKIIIDKIEKNYPNSKVLVVSHGAFMKVLFKELKCRGYVGKLKMKPKNGELYLFERK